MVKELSIDREKFEGTEEDYDALKEAVSRLAIASEKQFEEIKKEKWYNRVFDMLTFSQKGKKRIAEQVNSLAQAQQIVIELLLRLSSNDAKISQLVIDSMQDIRRIQEQNIELLSRIIKLENVSLGIRENMDIGQLSEKNKKLLSACLYYLCEKNNAANENQKKFANQVLNYLGTDVQMENPLSVIEDIDEDARKRILACCLEYMYLQQQDNEAFGEYQDFIDEFDLGRKTIHALKQQIMALEKLRGCEGIINKYKKDNYVEIDDVFLIEFSDDDEIQDNVEKEELVISSMLRISKEEAYVIRNKIVHINSYVNCEGSLEFNNCIIYYNETSGGDEIYLAQESSLKISNSTIICRGADETPFITGEYENNVIIEKTIFEDCAHFMELKMCKYISVQECELNNCYHKFLCVQLGWEAAFEMAYNTIRQEVMPEFNRIERFAELIFIKGVTENKQCLIHDNCIYESDTWSQNEQGAIQYLYSDGGTICNCIFTGVSKGIQLYNYGDSVKIQDCKFSECKNVISATNENVKIDNCIFEKCTDILEVGSNMQISNCQFVDCYDKLIVQKGWRGGLIIEFCQFVNTKYLLVSQGMSSWLYVEACITLKKDAKSCPNKIRKCIFDGVDMGQGFLIAAENYHEKPNGATTYIEECVFNNCSTKRSSGKIIKEFILYDTMFKKDESFHANRIVNCKGLDKINQEV